MEFDESIWMNSDFFKLFFKNEKDFDTFRKKIIKFFYFLEKKEGFIDNKYMPPVEFNKKYVYKSQEWFDFLTMEANQRMNFNWRISCFKMNQLLKNCISNFENNNHYVALILLRNIAEVTAFLYHTYTQISPLVEKINLTNDLNEYISTHNELESISRVFSYGSGIKEYVDKSPHLKIKSIMKSIDKVAKDKYSNFRMHYDGLSEIAHPNGQSNRIFGIFTEIEENKLKNNKINLINSETEYYFRDFNNLSKEMRVLSPILMMRATIVFMIEKNLEIFKETVCNFEKLNIKEIKVNT